MEYINTFNTTAEYNAAKSGETYGRPHVSLVLDNDEIHYENYDYSQDYLTFVIKTSGTFDLYPVETANVYYSFDNGETWSAVPSEGGTITVSAGDKLMWKGTLSNSEGKYWDKEIVEPGVHFDAQGNIMSLVYGDNFKGQTDLTGKALGTVFSEFEVENAKNLILPATTLEEGCYYAMFSNCTSLATAPVLPATTLANECYMGMFEYCTSLTTAPELLAITLASYCYNGMFNYCTSLTTAPELPATTLANGCYNYMFEGCSSLNYIKAMFTTTPSTTYTQNWVSGVSATGTFVKNAAAQWNVSGDNGVPNGWTVETAEENVAAAGGDDPGFGD